MRCICFLIPRRSYYHWQRRSLHGGMPINISLMGTAYDDVDEESYNWQHILSHIMDGPRYGRTMILLTTFNVTDTAALRFSLGF